MSKIVGVEGLSGERLQYELSHGGRFVVYQYCISILILTFRRDSNVYFIRGGRSGVSQGLIYSALSFLFGWWGIPWGPIYTIQSLIRNFQGGKDVTREVLDSLSSAARAQQQ